MIRVALILAFAVSITGCAGFSQGPNGVFSGSSTGTYEYNVSPDGGVAVKSTTLRGGPDMTITTDENGVKTVDIKSSNKQILGEVLKSIMPALVP